MRHIGGTLRTHWFAASSCVRIRATSSDRWRMRPSCSERRISFPSSRARDCGQQAGSPGRMKELVGGADVQPHSAMRWGPLEAQPTSRPAPRPRIAPRRCWPARGAGPRTSGAKCRSARGTGSPNRGARPPRAPAPAAKASAALTPRARDTSRNTGAEEQRASIIGGVGRANAPSATPCRARRREAAVQHAMTPWPAPGAAFARITPGS